LPPAGHNCISSPWPTLHIVSLFAKGLSPCWPGDFILSPCGQDCIQRPFILAMGLHQLYLLDKLTARQDYTFSPHGQNSIQSVPLFWPRLHEVYSWTSSLLDRSTPCLHMARTASSVPLYWPGLHQVYLLDKFHC
jgi:hypothetical protein